MAKGIRRRLKKALRACNSEIEGHASTGGKTASGLSGEGYVGGYAQALRDVSLMLDGVEPNTRFWRTDNSTEFAE